MEVQALQEHVSIVLQSGVNLLLGSSSLLARNRQVSDWQARPLEPEQLEYAAQAVGGGDFSEAVLVELKQRSRLFQLHRFFASRMTPQILKPSSVSQPSPDTPA